VNGFNVFAVYQLPLQSQGNNNVLTLIFHTARPDT